MEVQERSGEEVDTISEDNEKCDLLHLGLWWTSEPQYLYSCMLTIKGGQTDLFTPYCMAMLKSNDFDNHNFPIPSYAGVKLSPEFFLYITFKACGM